MHNPYIGRGAPIRKTITKMLVQTVWKFEDANVTVIFKVGEIHDISIADAEFSRAALTNAKINGHS
ncbi:MAG: hypothetical protein ACSHXY_12290 [Alphaproteobacteria bacterium]